MSKGTERERREALEKLRMEKGRGMTIYSLEPRHAGERSDRLFNADGMLWDALYSLYDDQRPLMSEVAADIGVNDELTRLILLGKREPSKAFLNAVGWERVTLYRRRAS